MNQFTAKLTRYFIEILFLKHISAAAEQFPALAKGSGNRVYEIGESN
ncbi:MAG: hypothetical protein JXJ22_12800 [Bacteroidales bacterium]|nr:hypothetical protein [Bacteroidales bacterium]